MPSASTLIRLGPHRSTRGAVAIITAIAAPVMLLLVGFIADYGYASYINQRLARATDAATLGSVSQTAATAAGGYGNTAYLQASGVKYFNANTSALGLTGTNFNLSVVSDGVGGVVATGTYSLNVPTFFSGILGFANIPVSGSAKTNARPLVYLNYYVLVDTSQSMGIAATDADAAALYQRVKNNKNASSADVGCVFGCHVPARLTTDVPPVMQTITNEALAHDSKYGTPITLRIDSAVTAVQSILSSAAQTAGTTKNIKFGLYTMGTDPTANPVTKIAPVKISSSPCKVADPPTSDYSALQTAAATIDLGNTVSTSNSGDTDYGGSFTAFMAGTQSSNCPSITPPTAQGSGTSATSPINYIFVVTDGLDDETCNTAPYFVCTAPIDPNECAPLKKNAIVGIIYTTYNPIYQYNTAPTLERRYAALADGKVQQIRSALQSCASSTDWFFEAQDGPALVSSMQALFLKTLPTTARLSQ